MTGSTEGSLPGNSSAGSADIFLTTFATDSGTQEWIRQWGTTEEDRGRGVDVDSSGNVYVTGYTKGAFSGFDNGGASKDIFLTKYNTSGTQQWMRQIDADEGPLGVAVDSSGNAYVTGYTWGVFPGQVQLGGEDIFLAKHNSSGTYQWIRQYGSAGNEQLPGVAVDSLGNVYVTGETSGNVHGANAGSHDIFLTKIDSSGTQQWGRQIGTDGVDIAYDAAVDSSGNLYVTGLTTGTLAGSSAGGEDVVLIKYDTGGTQQWIRQTGTSGDDKGLSVDVDSAGNVYVTGYTTGAFTGANAGDKDVFLLKYDTSGNLQ